MKTLRARVHTRLEFFTLRERYVPCEIEKVIVGLRTRVHQNETPLRYGSYIYEIKVHKF